ncbi:MAG: protease modulator HflC [Gammaproteobacteria bacterium]|nr:protease modulator HflC [Gammaproteobacteria bacterium]
MGPKAFIAVLLIGLLAGTAYLMAYTVDVREKAILFGFGGDIVRTDETPGLHFKRYPWDRVRKFDARILTMDAEAQNYLTSEKKELVVDSFLKWRIKDVATYFKTVAGSQIRAQTRLFQVVNNGLRNEFGKRTVTEVISGERRQIMDIILESTNRDASTYGIEVVDVRLKRVDLDPEISVSVYNRMEAERARFAKERRAQGAEAAERIRADADRQREIILAQAYRDSELLRGDGDAGATDVYARAFGKDPDFYALYRSLNAYRESFRDKNDVLILEPDSEFFRYFKQLAPE